MSDSVSETEPMYGEMDAGRIADTDRPTELLTEHSEPPVHSGEQQELATFLPMPGTLEKMAGSTHNVHAADVEIRNTDIDKGYAWIVLTGCFVMNAFVGGSVRAYGVLYTEMVEYYSTGYGNTAWIGGIASLLLLTLGPLANLLCRRFSFRLVTFVGGILTGLGYIMSAFVTKMEFMYLTFLCCGFGYGLTFSPCRTIVSLYFDKRRALANGITASGSGVAGLTFPLLFKFLIETYGLRGTFWITGGILCNICVAACVFRQPSMLVAESQQKKNGADICRCQMDLKFSLFKDLLFTMNVISFVLCTFAYFGNVTLIPSYVKALGYNKTYVALSVTIVGGVEVFARTFVGWFADLKIIKPKYILVVCMFIGAIISFITPLFDSFTFMAIYSVVVSMFPGSFFSLLSVLVIDIVGLEAFPAAFGLISLCLAFGTAISQPALGWIKDYFGSWHPAFILTGCAYVIAGIIILMEPIVIRLRKKSNQRNNDRNKNVNDDS